MSNNIWWWDDYFHHWGYNQKRERKIHEISTENSLLLLFFFFCILHKYFALKTFCFRSFFFSANRVCHLSFESNGRNNCVWKIFLEIVNITIAFWYDCLYPIQMLQRTNLQTHTWTSNVRFNTTIETKQ